MFRVFPKRERDRRSHRRAEAAFSITATRYRLPFFFYDTQSRDARQARVYITTSHSQRVYAYITVYRVTHSSVKRAYKHSHRHTYMHGPRGVFAMTQQPFKLSLQ